MGFSQLMPSKPNGQCNFWPANSMSRRDPCNWRCWGTARWRKWRRAASRNRRRRNLLYNCKSNGRSNYRTSRCSDKDPVRIRWYPNHIWKDKSKVKKIWFSNIFSRRNLQPSGPPGLTLASVIGHTVQTLASDAQIVDTLVNVDLAEITLITDQAITRVIG